MIDRRSFLGSLSASLAVSHRAQAQQGAKVYRVGWLQPSRPASAGFANFLQVMREFGYVEPHNVIYEARFAEGQFQRLPALAADLVRVRVDIIIAVATGAISAAKEATNDIPIVMAFSGIDPVEAGFVSTLGRPGGNVTGLTMLAPELSAKRADIVKQMLPGITRLGVLGYRPNPGTMAQVKAVEQAATRLGMTVHVSAVEEPGRYGDAFAIFAGRQVGAVLVLTDTVLASDRERIVDEGLKHRLATFFDFRESTEAGGFVSYGVSNLGLYRQAARFADRILKGAKPADLPIEQPTKFELVINLRTAKALSLTIPPSLLLRADYIIE